MKRIILICLFLGAFLSCEYNLEGGGDLIGEWFLITGCNSCALFEFENDGILKVSDIYDESPVLYNYHLLRNNNIEISGRDINGTYEIITHSLDTIEIIGFSLSGYPEYRNTRLKRK